MVRVPLGGSAIDVPVPPIPEVTMLEPGRFGGPGFTSGLLGLGLVSLGVVALLAVVVVVVVLAATKRSSGSGLRIAAGTALAALATGTVLLVTSTRASDAAQAEYDTAIATQEAELAALADTLAREVDAGLGVELANPLDVLLVGDGLLEFHATDAAGAPVACLASGTRDGAGWLIHVECPAPA